MNTRTINTTRTVAEAIVRRERPEPRNWIPLSGPDEDRVAEIRDRLNEIAASLGYDQSYLTGAQPVELIDMFHETRVDRATV